MHTNKQTMNPKAKKMDSRHSKISVLMLPWLAHGHISSFLELAKKLTTRNVHIFLCSTAVNLMSIKPKLSQKYSLSIEFVELHLPHLPELPPHYHTTNGLPPHLMSTLKKAFDMSTPNFSNILKTLSPDLLVYDFLQPWAPSLASSLNIPSVLFFSTSAVMVSFLSHFMKNPTAKFPFPEIYLLDYERDKFNNLLESSSNDLKDEVRVQQCIDRSCDIILLKTFREIEGEYIDYSSDLWEKKIVPAGPLVQDAIDQGGHEETEIIKWLNKRERSSVVFVSFGSEYFLSKEDIEEIAHGLELSKVSFIWVIRFPVGEEIGVDEVLPQRFVERVGKRGFIVKGWAPQAKILQHSSIGGFVSHCGWSSVTESMKFGVPIIAMPMHLDQPLNARLVEEVGIGVEVKKRGVDGRLQQEEIAKVIRDVVVEKFGEGVRRKAMELRENMKKKEDEEIDAVVVELMQLCRRSKESMGLHKTCSMVSTKKSKISLF